MATKRMIVHACLDVRGALLNWNDRTMRGVFKDDNGRVLSSREAKNVLLDEVAKGHHVIPIGGGCDGFDYETGCPGHPVDDEPVAKPGAAALPPAQGGEGAGIPPKEDS